MEQDGLLKESKGSHKKWQKKSHIVQVMGKGGQQIVVSEHQKSDYF